MRSPGDDRAVSSQIGAVLLLAIFVLAFSQYQLDVVPEQNRQVERDHSERVTGELVALRDSITAAGYRNGTRGTTVTLGTQYDPRILARNPPQPSGTLRTGDATEVVIDGVGDGPITLESKPIVYEPDYGEYDAAPTTRIEHTAVIRAFDDGNATVEEPTVVSADNETVIVPVVDGDLSRTATGTVSVEIETLEPYRTAPAGGEATIRLETAYPGEWDDIEGWERDNGTAVFSGDVEEVVIAHLAVGDASKGSDANDAIADYGEPFVDDANADDGIAVDVDPETITAGENETLRATVSDDGERIANAQVNFGAKSGGSVRITDNATTRTNESGVAALSVRAEEAGNGTFYASALGSTERVTIEVEEQEATSFESVGASDAENGGSQTFEMDLSGDVEDGERIEITLDDAQTEAGGQDGVDYRDAVAEVIEGKGEVEGNAVDANRGQGTATMTYVAGAGDDTIVIDVSGYEIDGDENAPYTAEFTVVDAGTSATDEFDVVT